MAEGADLRALNGTYKNDPLHSSLTFKIDHMGLSHYTARFTKFSATLDLSKQSKCRAARSSVRSPYNGGELSLNLQDEVVTGMTFGEAAMELLAAYEVDTVFGMAGTMTLEVYRGIARTGIRHVQCRNEQGASLMADGYARATGKPGVCTIIGGPGVTNASTGIAQAYCDSQPMLVLSGACATRTLGKGWGAIHELADQAAVTAGFTAFSAMVRYPEELPELIARAYAVFRGSRPRPVYLSLPRDVLPEPVEDDWKTRRAPSLPMPDPAAIDEAADRLAQAKRPLILVC